MKNKTLRTILGIVFILVLIALTFSVIKVLPIFLKLLTLGADVATIYLIINWIKNKKTKTNKN